MILTTLAFMLLGFQISFPELEGKWTGAGCQMLMASKFALRKKKIKSQLNHHFIIFVYEIFH